MRILAIPLFLLSVLTGWCADVNITNVPLSATIIYSDYLLGLTGTVNLANSHSRLLKVSDLSRIVGTNLPAVLTNNVSTAQPTNANLSLWATQVPTTYSNVLANLASNYTWQVSNTLYSAGGGITTAQSNTIINLASNYTWQVSNTLYTASGALPSTNGTGSTATLYGVNVMPGTLQVSNLISTNMSVDTINAGTLVVTNGIGATNITGILSNNTTGQAGSIPMGIESTSVNYFPVLVDSTGTNYVEGGAFNYSNSVLTMNGPVVSIAASASNSPAQNEFPTAHWVRSLFNNGVLDYSATNVDLTATNSDGYIVYKFLGAIPLTTTRTYSAVTNGEYMGGSVTTNSFMFLQGPIDVHAFLQKSASGTALVHPEIYYSYDKTNWLGDWTAGDQSITTGTNLYGWVISFPAITSTNATGFYVQRRYKVTSQTSTPDITLHIGTNFVSGPNDASHIAFSGPNSGTGNAYLPNNQTFSGNNTFTGTVSLGGETQVTNNFTYMMRTTNDFAAGASNVIVNMDISTLNLDPLTNNICLTNFTGLVVGTSKNKLIRINPSATFTITYPPDGSVPGGGLFWRTNCPPQANRPYTSVTNGSIYILSITSMGTNVMASMTEWK